MMALYSSGPTASSFSQPGMAVASVSGSNNADHTRSRGAGISVAPSIFIGSPHCLDGTRHMTSQTQAGHVAIPHRRVDQQRPVGHVDGADGSQPERVAPGIV